MMNGDVRKNKIMDWNFLLPKSKFGSEIFVQETYSLVRKTINEDYRSALNPGSFAGRTTQSAKTDLNDFAFSPKWIYCMF